MQRSEERAEERAACGGEIEKERDGVAWFCQLLFSSPGSSVVNARAEDDRMERMESMEPITAHYTTAYPEIHPDSGYESRETTDSQAKTPPAPTYDEELVHKV